MKVVLLLVYLWMGKSPELMVERKDFTSFEACNKAGMQRGAELAEDKRFIEGVFGDCLVIPNEL